MKRIFAFLLLVAFLISGCSFDLQVLTPTPAAPTSHSITALPTGDLFSATPTPDNIVLPALFYGAYFALESVETGGISSFPAGTKKIYAIWNYHNMRDGMVVKREWYLDGKLWLTREEPWDFAKYGVNGTIRDISIYDFDAGLPSGIYQLRLFVDNVPQPIGVSPDGQGQNWLNFEIKPLGEAISATSSPDNLWGAYIYGKKRIVLRDITGAPRELFTGREISYLTWFADSKHFLFVDRDYSGQQPGSPLGIRDDLYIAVVATGEVTLLYQSDSPFQEYGGPQPSLDGTYIGGLVGSGFGDACFVDSRLIFFELAGDFKSAKVIEQSNFMGIPTATDSVVYPAAEGAWRTGNQYAVTLKGTCGIDQSLMGTYIFDVPNLKATFESAGTTPMIPGDLGWGKVHGIVTDAVTGKPIAGATVTCQHSSYTSPAPCSGSITTDAQGMYVFENVFFHDTDTITLTVQAPGYQPKEIKQAFFTMPDWEVNISLNYPP